MSSAKIPAILEPVGLSREDGKRPDGMSLFPWKNGKLLVWDFTCVHTTAPSNVHLSERGPGKVADEAEARKLRKYKSLENDFIVTPVAAETFGAWGSSGHNLIKLVGKRITEATSEQRATTFLFQTISIALQRANALCILGTLPNNKSLEEIFYL